MGDRVNGWSVLLILGGLVGGINPGGLSAIAATTPTQNLPSVHARSIAQANREVLAVVTRNNANVYAGPGSNHRVLGQLQQGQRVTLQAGQNGRWSRLNKWGNQSGGWISTGDIRIVQDDRPTATWTLLGERRVTDRADHDTILVTALKGTFRKLKFKVKDQSVQFYRVTVHYATGAPEQLQLRQVIPAGGESRAIDLQGGNRVIRKIEFWYEAKSAGWKAATIQVYGLP